jgi:hypothetical protein
LARGEHFRGDLKGEKLLTETPGFWGSAQSAPQKAFAILEKNDHRNHAVACLLK